MILTLGCWWYFTLAIPVEFVQWQLTYSKWWCCCYSKHQSVFAQTNPYGWLEWEIAWSPHLRARSSVENSTPPHKFDKLSSTFLDGGGATGLSRLGLWCFYNFPQILTEPSFSWYSNNTCTPFHYETQELELHFPLAYPTLPLLAPYTLVPFPVR